MYSSYLTLLLFCFDWNSLGATRFLVCLAFAIKCVCCCGRSTYRRLGNREEPCYAIVFLLFLLQCQNIMRNIVLEKVWFWMEGLPFCENLYNDRLSAKFISFDKFLINRGRGGRMKSLSIFCCCGFWGCFQSYSLLTYLRMITTWILVNKLHPEVNSAGEFLAPHYKKVQSLQWEILFLQY